MDARDPGLQPERTALAWRRTALSLASAAAIGARVLFPSWGIASVCLAVAGGGLAIGLWVAGSRRYRRACLRPDGNGLDPPGAAALAGFAALATAAGLAALLFVLGR